VHVPCLCVRLCVKCVCCVRTCVLSLHAYVHTYGMCMLSMCMRLAWACICACVWKSMLSMPRAELHACATRVVL